MARRFTKLEDFVVALKHKEHESINSFSKRKLILIVNYSLL